MGKQTTDTELRDALVGLEPAPWRFPARKRKGVAAMRVWLNHHVRPCRNGTLNGMLVWSRCGLETWPMSASRQATAPRHERTALRILCVEPGASGMGMAASASLQ